MSVLSGARNARNSVLASKLYKKMQQIFPNEKDGLISASILLSNIYMSIGDDEQASAIRQYRLNNYGRKVTPGEASTEDNDEILVSNYIKRKFDNYQSILLILFRYSELTIVRIHFQMRFMLKQ